MMQTTGKTEYYLKESRVKVYTIVYTVQTGGIEIEVVQTVIGY